MNIILIGYRASGKTSVGRLLADALGRPFKDVDDETCQVFDNATIADIWRQHGEPAWRREETAVTQKLCAQDGLVIALGGGTLMQPAARQAVEQADAVRIYLQAPADELHRRVQADSRSVQTRPSLTGQGGGLEEISHMLEQREPTYLAVADHVLDVTFTPVEDAVRYILDHCLR